jgi:hypothetical protein
MTPAASMTGTQSTAVKPLQPVTNLRNFCPAEKRIACLVWDVPNGFNYRSFELQYKGANTAFVTVTGIKTPAYTLTGLDAGSTYQFQVTALTNGMKSPPSTVASITTAVDKFNGVRNVACRRRGNNVVCRWQNGANRYKNIKLLVTCPPNTGKRMKYMIPRGQNVYTAPLMSGQCKVQFIPNYVNGRTGPKHVFRL